MKRKIVDEVRRLLRVLPSTLKLVWSVSRKWTIAWSILLIIQALLPLAIVLLLKQVVDSLVALLSQESAQRDLDSLITWGGLFALTLIVSESIQSLTEWIRLGQANRVEDRIADLIYAKAIEVDLACYEEAAYFDKLQQASSEGASRALTMLESAGALARGGLTLATMAGVLIPYGAWLPIALLTAAAPTFWVLVKHNRKYQEWWEASTHERRKNQYNHHVLTHSHTAAELRLLGIGPLFATDHGQRRKKLMDEELELTKRRSRAQMTGSLTSSIMVLLCLAWMGLKVLKGLATLGDVALFHQTFMRGQTQLRSTLRGTSDLLASSLFLEKFHEYMAIESSVVDPDSPLEVDLDAAPSIQFDGVSFAYPSSKVDALSDVSFKIQPGELLAIVGRNGAGKSTLVKLLSRLYDPSRGAIRLNGTDVREFRADDLRAQMAVLHQQPIPYLGTIEEVIGFGDIRRNPSRDEVIEAAKKARAWEFISSLPNGLETQLGKNFAGGTDLSVGQWQRLSLSRACLRDSKVVVLDEPTSFMDPWAEAKWVSGIRELLSGKTSILITHRFPTARLADRILVISEGRISESGTHDELLAAGGDYADSWKEQESLRLV